MTDASAPLTLQVYNADVHSFHVNADRAAWLKKLDDIAALKPSIVVPGHSAANQARDISQVTYTQTYLQRFEVELKKAHDSAQLIAAMKSAYPNAGFDVALDIGAKVTKGEMKW